MEFEILPVSNMHQIYLATLLFRIVGMGCRWGGGGGVDHTANFPTTFPTLLSPSPHTQIKYFWILSNPTHTHTHTHTHTLIA